MLGLPMNETMRVRSAERQSDADLFARIAAGQLDALGQLFDRHHATLRHALVRLAPRSMDVDDLVQDAFLTAARAAVAYDGRDCAVPFLMGVAIRLLAGRRRSFTRLRVMLERFERAPREGAPDAEQLALEGAGHHELQRAIQRLDPKRRSVLVLLELCEMSGVEVGVALGIPVGTVWRRAHEARTELKRILERRADAPGPARSWQRVTGLR